MVVAVFCAPAAIEMQSAQDTARSRKRRAALVEREGCFLVALISMLLLSVWLVARMSRIYKGDETEGEKVKLISGIASGGSRRSAYILACGNDDAR